MSWHYLRELGGGILGTHLLGWRTVCAVEIDAYCREVLLRRQRDGLLPLFPIWDNVRTFNGKLWRGLVDAISAGFPCQPFSIAGDGAGEFDPRNCWPDTIRIIRDVGPGFVWLENVANLLNHAYARTIFRELAEAGFDAQWACVSGEDVGAPIVRERLFIAAISHQKHGQKRLGTLEEWTPTLQRREIRSGNELWLSTPPERTRMGHRITHYVDRVGAIGNAQIPTVVRHARQLLTGERL